LSAGAPPRPHWGSLQRSPRSPSWILGGLTCKGGEGKGRGRKGREGEERKEGGRDRRGEGWEEGGSVGPPKLKLAPPLPQNYFPGAGAGAVVKFAALLS